MHLILFEDGLWAQLAPLALSRPVFCLACGGDTLLDKQIRHLRPERLTLWVRPGLADYCRSQIVPRLTVPTAVNAPLDTEPALLVNGRALALGRADAPESDAVDAASDGSITAAVIRGGALGPADALDATPAWQKLLQHPRFKTPLRLAAWPWDLLAWNSEAIAEDSRRLAPRPHRAGPCHLINPDRILVADDATLEPGCVLDAAKGPVVISGRAVVGANAVLQGPCWIGPDTAISPLAYIRPGTTIGADCKIAGEVSASIVMGHTNKSHYGYLGDSYVGQWVNLGAGTTTSNLKNTYGPVTVQLGPRHIPTGRQNLGSLIGDHTKTAIGTRLNTGTYVGYFCMLALSAIAPRFVPSFSFMTDHDSSPYDLDKARQVMMAVFARRGRPWTDADGEMLRFVSETAGGL